MIDIMRYVLGTTAVAIGVLCSLAIGVVYGYSLSSNPAIAIITASFGFAAVSIEVFGYHRAAQLYDGGRYVAFVMCIVGCLIASAINVTFDFGFLASTFDSAKTVNMQAVNSRADLEAERKRIIAGAAAYAGARSTEAVDADLTATRMNPRWISSDNCTNATAPDSIRLCATYASLIAERGRSEASRNGTERLRQIAAELSGQRAVTTDDARAETLSRLSGYPKQIIETAIMLALILFLRFLTAMAPFVIWDRQETAPHLLASGRDEAAALGGVAHDTPLQPNFDGAVDMSMQDAALANEDRAPMSDDQMARILGELIQKTGIREPDDIDSGDGADGGDGIIDVESSRRVPIDPNVEKFAASALLYGGDDYEATAEDMLRAYRKWCVSNGILVQSLSQREFSMMISQVVVRNGGSKRKRSKIIYCGVKISPTFSDDDNSSDDGRIIPIRGRASLGPVTGEVINRSAKSVDDTSRLSRVFRQKGL